MWELKGLLVALLILFFVGFLPAMVPMGIRLALPPAGAAIIYLLVGITLGVLLT